MAEAKDNPLFHFMLTAAIEEEAIRSKKRKQPIKTERNHDEDYESSEDEEEEEYEAPSTRTQPNDYPNDKSRENDEEDDDDDSSRRNRSDGEDSMPKKDNKKRRVKSIAQSRSIFKKAVLKVFLEQRKKGVHTLSLSQVWSLIREAGLIKTMGKTPIQSVSCALSQDVLRGAESSFVRVGKGLYSLKEGITDQYLEQYLDGPSWSADSPTKTNSANANNNNKKFSSDEAPETPPSSDVSSPAQGGKISKWIGQPLYTIKNRVYYSSVQIDKHVYRLGSCAYLEAPNYEKPFLGRISSLFQEEEQKIVECVWYFYPEDTSVGKMRGSNEVFLSRSRDINSVDALLSPKVEVVSYLEYMEREKEQMSMEDVYYCKQYYSWENETFAPINLNENIYVLAAQLDKLQAKSVVNMLLTELQLYQIEMQSAVSSPTSQDEGSPKNFEENHRHVARRTERRKV